MHLRNYQSRYALPACLILFSLPVDFPGAAQADEVVAREVFARPAAAPQGYSAAPTGEALCEDYKLTVGGVEVPVYACRVSAVPFNQVWPGYQRPLDQTEVAGFAFWDMSEPVSLEIHCKRTVDSVQVRPQSLGIKPVIAGENIRLTLERPRPIVIEMDGPHHALHLFASPLEQEVPQADVPNVRYFGPGVHRPGKIELQNNQTVYIAGGAVVYGCISGTGVSHVRICGGGILDGSQFERGQGGGAVKLQDCSDIVIEGIVMRDPDVWCCSLFGCRQATTQNIKLIGLWRYNSDGIDICPESWMRGLDAEHTVSGVSLVNLRFNDERLQTAHDAQLRLGENVQDVLFSE